MLTAPSPFILCLALHLTLGSLPILAAESLPPLGDGPVPSTLEGMWGHYDPRAEPVQGETLKEWEENGVVCRVIRYQVGVLKDKPVLMVGLYAFPKGGTGLPTILQMHGGGQSAGMDGVVTYAKRGYACLSLNWGGNKLNFGSSRKIAYDGPNTDWGNLDATHIPQRNKVNHFAGPLTPDAFTLDPVESPRNSNWFLVVLAARRAITFLEQQPEVDRERIGATGHSMGGKLTTMLAGIDPRIRAAVPSCGGAGVVTPAQAAELPGTVPFVMPDMQVACVTENTYLPRITCPILWLSPTNDFHGAINNMAWNWRQVPDRLVGFSIAPHHNHRHEPNHELAGLLWFEQHLKHACVLPGTPRLDLKPVLHDGKPGVLVTPDRPDEVRHLEVYYSIGLNDKVRFWRQAPATRAGGTWTAECPIMSLEAPIFTYANVSYATPEASLGKEAQAISPEFTLSSRVATGTPAELRSAGTKATDLPERMIDDGSRGWADWFTLNWDHAPLWSVTTRKLTDPKWRGPEGGTLVFEIICQADSTLCVKVGCNGWGAYQSSRPVDYVAVRPLTGAPDWQTIRVPLTDLVSLDPTKPGPPKDWQTVTEFSLSPHGETIRDGVKVPVEGKPWKGPRSIRNLRWEGGVYVGKREAGSTLSEEEFQKQFNESIRSSLNQERLDAQGKP